MREQPPTAGDLAELYAAPIALERIGQLMQRLIDAHGVDFEHLCKLERADRFVGYEQQRL